MSAQVKILVQGYTNADSVAEAGEERTCPTITLVKDGNLIMVVDPGVLPDRKILIEALAELNLNVEDVNMVCITHSHIDHYRNIGMFPKAKVLEFFGIWHDDAVEELQKNLTENVQVLKTPGHDYSCITILVNTADHGKIAICGDVFWKENYPETDPYATNLEELEVSRQAISKMADWIIPGHGDIFKTHVNQIIDGEQKVLAVKAKGAGVILKCRKCKKIMLKQERCLCRQWFCFRCCECETDCNLCSCSHKKR